jgi:hypothetical protein
MFAAEQRRDQGTIGRASVTVVLFSMLTQCINRVIGQRTNP